MSEMREIRLPERHSVADVELAERVATALNSASLRVFSTIPGPAPVLPAPAAPAPGVQGAALVAAEAVLLGVARLVRGLLRV